MDKKDESPKEPEMAKKDESPKEPKAPKEPKEPKTPRVRKDPTDPMAIGFAKFRAEHPALKDERLGRVVQHKGDDIAVKLTDEMAVHGDIWNCPLVKDNLDVEKLQAKYAKLNPGMVRMNIANILRGLGGKREKEQAKAEAKAKREAEAAEKRERREAEKLEAKKIKAEKAEAE